MINFFQAHLKSIFKNSIIKLYKMVDLKDLALVGIDKPAGHVKYLKNEDVLAIKCKVDIGVSACIF
jgi:hypothetical protein